jgi:hypothetical protein
MSRRQRSRSSVSTNDLQLYIQALPMTMHSVWDERPYGTVDIAAQSMKTDHLFEALSSADGLGTSTQLPAQLGVHLTPSLAAIIGLRPPARQ